MLDSWVHASIQSGGATETSKVVDVLLPLGRKQHLVSKDICFVYITDFAMQLSVVHNLILKGSSDDSPRVDFLVIDAVGLRSMYFVIMPRVNLIVILMTYVCYLYSINCPTVICLPSMYYLSYGETPLVNCGPRSNILYIAILFYFYSHCLLSCILLSYYHSIRSILCLQQTGEIDNLIVSWEQSSWVCCVQVSH
jgi:hypothetical protein